METPPRGWNDWQTDVHPSERMQAGDASLGARAGASSRLHEDRGQTEKERPQRKVLDLHVGGRELGSAQNHVGRVEGKGTIFQLGAPLLKIQVSTAGPGSWSGEGTLSSSQGHMHRQKLVCQGAIGRAGRECWSGGS